MKKLMLPIFATIATTSISSQLVLNINNHSVLASNKILLNQEKNDTAIKLDYARQIFQKYTEQFSKYKSDFNTLTQRFNEKWNQVNQLEVIPTDSKEKQEFLKVVTDYLAEAVKQVNNIIAFKSKHLALQPQELRDNSMEEIQAEIQEHLNELDPKISNIDAKLSYIITIKEQLQFSGVNEILEKIYQHNNKKFLEFNLPNDIKVSAIAASKKSFTNDNDIEENQRLDEAKAIFKQIRDEYKAKQESLKTREIKFNEFWNKNVQFKNVKELAIEEKTNRINLAHNYLVEMNSNWTSIKNLKNIHVALLPQAIRNLTKEKINDIQTEIDQAISQLSTNHKNFNSKLSYIFLKMSDFTKKATDLLVNIKLIEEHNQYKWDNFDK
ncbi:MAG: hypothetical protein REH79_00790 [Spiroplasma sp.]|nr:hypothetical protein [Spiroplasma sp.]